MLIEYQYMSNICQTQMEDKWNSKTNKRNKREQEKGPRGVSRSEGSKTLSLRVRRFKDFEHHATSCDIMGCRKTDEVSRTQRFEDFEDSSKALKTLQWLHEGFPLTITPP